MKNWLVTFLAAFVSHFWGAVEASALEQPLLDFHAGLFEDQDQIRVKIFPHSRHLPPHGRDEEVDKIRLSSTAPCRIYRGSNQTSTRGDRRLVGRKNEINVHIADLVNPLWVECDHGFTIHRAEGLESFSYDGGLYLTSIYSPKRKQRVVLAVNVLRIEDYLKGVLPSEVFPFWHREALKSQAVAARTYATFHMTMARSQSRQLWHKYYDLTDTIAFQAYTGLSQQTPQTNRAVEATAGEILLHRGSVIQAYYHADSGGKTEDCLAIFGVSAGYCQGKDEPFHNRLVKTGRWQQKFALADINLRLKKLGIPTAKNVRKIFTYKGDRTPGGRLTRVQLVTANGSRHWLSARRFKAMFGLKSTKFWVVNQAGGVTIHGKGSGHGVGLNQKGARVLAESKGWTYQRILSHYYNKVRMCRLFPKDGDGDVPSCKMVASSSS